MNTDRICRLAALVGIVLGWLLCRVDANAETESRGLAVNDPRPVAQAIFQLIKEYPTVISYEDPRYVYSEDIQDITDRVRPNRSGPRILVPKGGPLQVTYEINADSKQPVSYANVLGAILEAARVDPSGGRLQSGGKGRCFM